MSQNSRNQGFSYCLLDDRRIRIEGTSNIELKIFLSVTSTLKDGREEEL
jgi:hypothetical protein